MVFIPVSDFMLETENLEHGLYNFGDGLFRDEDGVWFDDGEVERAEDGVWFDDGEVERAEDGVWFDDGEVERAEDGVWFDDGEVERAEDGVWFDDGEVERAEGLDESVWLGEDGEMYRKRVDGVFDGRVQKMRYMAAVGLFVVEWKPGLDGEPEHARFSCLNICCYCTVICTVQCVIYMVPFSVQHQNHYILYCNKFSTVEVMPPREMRYRKRHRTVIFTVQITKTTALYQ
ncbi:hypothetical protein VC83_08235 [Pseudogymnoascus destructans]|uniref:Uncharacterized protein n=1 Tax=Pseudogymnoascus destructans TaxID=655981 RepID=A0A177A2G3_9PEZI|nr:uncharacterized protein VC83_08235 [Pseudogymnoascus destructans]OAF55273.1 hypothetical protein VC83_08235 [Pseudogymnoascus destructans]